MACCKACWTAQGRAPQQTLPTSLLSPRYILCPKGARERVRGGGGGGLCACLVAKHAGQHIQSVSTDNANLFSVSWQKTTPCPRGGWGARGWRWQEEGSGPLAYVPRHKLALPPRRNMVDIQTCSRDAVQHLHKRCLRYSQAFICHQEEEAEEDKKKKKRKSSTKLIYTGLHFNGIGTGTSSLVRQNRNNKLYS